MISNRQRYPNRIYVLRVYFHLHSQCEVCLVSSCSHDLRSNWILLYCLQHLRRVHVLELDRKALERVSLRNVRPYRRLELLLAKLQSSYALDLVVRQRRLHYRLQSLVEPRRQVYHSFTRHHYLSCKIPALPAAAAPASAPARRRAASVASESAKSSAASSSRSPQGRLPSTSCSPRC